MQTSWFVRPGEALFAAGTRTNPPLIMRALTCVREERGAQHSIYLFSIIRWRQQSSLTRRLTL